MKELIKHIVKEDNFLSLSGNGLVALFGFGSFMILARTLSIELFGEWVLFIAGGSLIEMLRFGITGNGLVRFLSGAKASSRACFIGSNSFLMIGVTCIISLILIGTNTLAFQAIQDSGYELFFSWYPFLAFINIPWNNAIAILQADRKFDQILVLRAINSGGFLLVVTVNFFLLDMSLTQIIIAYMCIHGITSLYALKKRWDGIFLITKASKSTSLELLNFGKYSTFTLIGTNLLRNSDIIVISLSPFGSDAVAVYSIALKLTEIQQIPLRSFAATAFPKMSKLSIMGNISALRDIFHTYVGALTVLFIFLCLMTFIFAEDLVSLIAGNQYLISAYSSELNTVLLVRILSLYGLLLPLDRMTGIALDSLNKPRLNALKVSLMLLTNLIGDLIAIYVFNSLVLVALTSIIFTGLGAWIGVRFLSNSFSTSYIKIYRDSIQFFKTQYWMLKTKFNLEISK